MIKIEDFLLSYTNFNLMIPKLSIENKGIYLLNGPNGCGKTALIRSIVGLNNRYKGNIFINEENRNNLSSKDIIKKISFLPQIPTLLPAISGKEFIEQGLYLPGESQIPILIKKLNVHSLLEKNCQIMSSGEKQLICIIRNLALKKPIILLDEPESFLSKSNRLIFSELISFLSEKSLILISSHYPELYNSDITIQFIETQDYYFNIKFS